MQKGKGFFRLVVAISILIFLIMSPYLFFKLEMHHYSTWYYKHGLGEPAPHGKHTILGLVGGVASTIPVWIIYGLTIFVVKGFKGQKE